MTIIHTKTYDPILLQCGSPPHMCDPVTFCKLQTLTCPTCSIPISTSLDERIYIKNYLSELRALLEKKPDDLSKKDITTLEINKLVRLINLQVDRFVFRGIPGLEFIQDKPINLDTFRNYAYAFPGRGTIRILEEFLEENSESKETTTIIEYGAGTALWSRFFIENGFESLAIDCKKTHDLYISTRKSFLEEIGKSIHYVEENECGLPLDCSKKLLFLCWPENPSCTLHSMYAQKTLKEFRKRGGDLAIYVGQHEYIIQEEKGVTASPGFFKEMRKAWNYSIVPEKTEAIQSLLPTKPTETFESMYLLKKISPAEALFYARMEITMKVIATIVVVATAAITIAISIEISKKTFNTIKL